MVSRSALFAHSKTKESIMKVKNLILAGIAGTAAILSAPVFADNRGHDHDRGWHGNPHFAHRYYAAPRIVYAPPPRVIYAPPAVVYPGTGYYGYAPAPRYYPTPAAVYGPPVVASPGVSIRFHLPL
jgi:hypothetical protein